MNLTEITSPNEWKKLFPEGVHFLQSYAWGELKMSSGNSHHYIVGGDNDVACMLLIKTVGPFTVGYIPRGPHSLKSKNAAKEYEFTQEIQKQYGLDLLNVDPAAFLDEDYGKQWLELLNNDSHARLTRQVQSRGTAVSDLSKIPGVLNDLDKSTRYNIRKSAKDGISFNVIPATADSMSQFYKLYVGTGGRKGFGVYSESYYQELVRCMTNDPNMDAFFGVASHSDYDQPLSMAFLLVSGKQAFYFYAASTLHMRNSMPNYGLQWHCLNWANDNGAETYDWWGAPFDKTNMKDSMYGVWHFKKSFLPNHKQLVGNHSMIAKSLKGYAAFMLLLGRDSLLSLRKKVKAVLP